MQENREIKKEWLIREDVTIQDIEEQGMKIGINLTEEEKEKVFNEYNRIVMDKGEGWEELITGLIIKGYEHKE